MGYVEWPGILQWIALKGPENYRRKNTHWIKLNVDFYRRTGIFMEKYNVENTSLDAADANMPDNGFGWTNGVLLKLMPMSES